MIPTADHLVEPPGCLSFDGFGLAVMLSENLICGDRRCLGAVADAELGVEMTELSLDGILTDVEMTAEFTIRHSRRKQGQELALSFGKTSRAPASTALHRSARVAFSGSKRPFRPCRRPNAIDDLIPRYGFGNETLCARAVELVAPPEVGQKN